MKIKYLGHSCFEITSAQGTSVITDPYTKVGYELPQGLTADAVTTSHGHFDHNYTEAVRCATLISTTGEHHVREIKIIGADSWHDEQNGKLRGNNVIYTVHVDGVTVCHLGDLGERISPQLLKKIGVVDVLLIPVGGTYTIDATQAADLIGQVAPKIAIPMHFKPEDGKLDISPLSEFLRFFPSSIIIEKKTDEVELHKGELSDSLSIICLERQ